MKESTDRSASPPAIKNTIGDEYLLLVFDDKFGMKYVGEEHAKHLFTSLK